MKTTRYIMLIIGTLGMAATIYNFLKEDSIVDLLLGVVVSSGLIYGYFYYSNFGKKEEK